MSIGDGVAQHLEGGKKVGESTYDPTRLGILTTWAALVNAPFWTWYRFLHKRWPGKVLGWVVASASLSPFWNAAFFVWTTSLTHALKAQDGVLQHKLEDRLSTQLGPTVLKSCCLWIPFNFVRQ